MALAVGGNIVTGWSWPGTWKADKFDHDRDSQYKLLGQHQGARCDGCHPGRLYKPTPTNCGAAPCHKADDAHRERLGNQCEHCHRETGENIFQHNTQAAFKLPSTRRTQP